MIKKTIILLLVLSLVFPLPVFSVTQYYYLTAYGSGLNSGNSGLWRERPTTEANAMSAAQFSSDVNWSDTENLNFLDPDDVVYIKGANWTGPDLYIRGPIVLDGWETGVFNRKSTTDQAVWPILTQASRIYVYSDGVTIRDLRFEHDSSYNILVGLTPTYTFSEKISRFKFTNNYLYQEGDNGAHIWAPFICDSEISYNYSYATNVGALKYRKFMSMGGGSRNKFFYNDRVGHYGWYVTRTRVLGISPIPPSGQYRHDPDYNPTGNEFAYNTLNRWPDDEEGWTFDAADGAPNVPIYERDTVASVSGLEITLTDTGYTADGKDYSGLYAVNVTNDVDKYGKASIIGEMAGSVITVEEDISAAAGDIIQIGIAAYHNWFHHNETDSDGEDRGFGTSTFLLEGVAIANLVEDNTIYVRGNGTVGGMKLSTPDGGFIPTSGGYAWNDSVTSPPYYGAAAYNIFRNNTVGAIFVGRFDSALGNDTLDTPSYNNALYGNYFNNAIAIGGGYELDDTYVWLPEAQRDDVNTSRSTGYTYLDEDPTTAVATWFSNWESGAEPPDTPDDPTEPGGDEDTTAPTVTAASGTNQIVVVSFSENVDASGYDTGDFVLQCSQTGLQNMVYQSGAGVSDDQYFAVTIDIVAGDNCVIVWSGTTGDIVDEAENDLSASSNTVYTGVSEGGTEDNNVSAGTVGSGAGVVLGAGAKIIVE